MKNAAIATIKTIRPIVSESISPMMFPAFALVPLSGCRITGDERRLKGGNFTAFSGLNVSSRHRLSSCNQRRVQSVIPNALYRADDTT